MNILAIDPGSTNIGIATDDRVYKHTIRWKNLGQLIKGIYDLIYGVNPSYILIELQMRKRYNDFVAVATTIAWMLDIQCKVVHAMSVKRHFGIPAKRNHTENKKAAVAKVQELWPEKKITDHNIADALLMYEYARHLISQNKF